MRILCVAEKPSISRAVSQTLGGGRVTIRDSSLNYVKNYDFTFNFPNWGQCDVTMTSVSGHITEVEFPPQFGWGKCKPEDLYDANVIIQLSNDKGKKISDNIAKEARNADYLMIWTDCDREGEYIGWEIVEQAKKQNPRINLDTAYRAHFSHLERRHVIHAASNPVRLDKKVIDAVRTRMEIDLRTGVSFTRFLTDAYRSKLPSQPGSNMSTTVSYGGCQFPTLGFVVDRFKRIKNFISEDFWSIKLAFRRMHNEKGEPRKTLVSWERGHLFDRFAVVCIFQGCVNIDGDTATVVSVEAKPTSNWAPLPLTTVELQKDCSRYFRMSAKEALSSAETLYNKGFVSYPRTETDKFPRAMDLKALIRKQSDSEQWGEYADSLANDNGKFRQPREGNHDDKAHPPIHPVTYAGTNAQLTVNEKKVYEYIVRRFLGCCSRDATGEKTTIRLKWGTELFSTSGLVVKELNYLEIYTYHKWASSNTNLPKVSSGERVKLVQAEISTGKTTPPPKLTETELIALMDKNGIGTDATIAEHIEKILTREYILKESERTGRSSSKYLIPTELGFALAEGFNQIGFDNISLTKPFLRKSLEDKLKAICDGRTTKNNVLNEILLMYREAYHLTTRNSRVLLASYDKVKSANA